MCLKNYMPPYTLRLARSKKVNPLLCDSREDQVLNTSLLDKIYLFTSGIKLYNQNLVRYSQSKRFLLTLFSRENCRLFVLPFNVNLRIQSDLVNPDFSIIFYVFFFNSTKINSSELTRSDCNFNSIKIKINFT